MKLHIILGGLLMLITQGCNHLDKELEDQIGKDKFFVTANASALEQYCNFFYPKLIHGHGSPQSYGFGMLEGEFKSDNLLGWDYNKISFGLHIAPTDKNNTEWNWEINRACNDFLKNYHLSPEAEIIKQRYAGEILFFKSMDYFNKVKAYGDVPWYDKALTIDDADLYKARDSRILVMDNVLKDLNQSIEWLPKKTKVYRISKDAALALKARICLFEGTFRRYHNIEGDVKFLEAAYAAAGELMKAEYGYKLFTGSKPSKAYHELFIQSDYNNNSEVILSKEYDPQKGKGLHLTSMIISDGNIGMSKAAADGYLCANTGLPISMCDCHKKHTTLIAELKNRDPRLLQTIPTPEAGEFTYYLEGKRPAIGKIVSGNMGPSSTGYCIVKFYDPAAASLSGGHHQGTSDAPIFRFAEILLVRAEAGAELGKDPELDKTINTLRSRVGFTHTLTAIPVVDPKLEKEYPIIKGNNAALIREIRRERRIELFGEGYRYDDLMRWAAGHNLAEVRTGIIPDLATSADDMTGYTEEEMKALEEHMGFEKDGSLNIYGKRAPYPAVFESPKHYLFAIPLNEISLNPNLAPNNSGW